MIVDVKRVFTKDEIQDELPKFIEKLENECHTWTKFRVTGDRYDLGSAIVEAHCVLGGDAYKLFWDTPPFSEESK